MTVFKRKLGNTDKNVKFTGVHLPLELNSYLVLFAAGSDTSKSRLIENQLYQWKEEMEKKMTVSELISVLIEKALITFRNLPSKNKSLSNFLNELQQELIKKGVEKSIVLKIRRGVAHGTSK